MHAYIHTTYIHTYIHTYILKLVQTVTYTHTYMTGSKLCYYPSPLSLYIYIHTYIHSFTVLLRYCVCGGGQREFDVCAALPFQAGHLAQNGGRSSSLELAFLRHIHTYVRTYVHTHTRYGYLKYIYGVGKNIFCLLFIAAILPCRWMIRNCLYYCTYIHPVGTR